MRSNAEDSAGAASRRGVTQAVQTLQHAGKQSEREHHDLQFPRTIERVTGRDSFKGFDVVSVLERDSRQMGVTYVSGPFDREYLLGVAGHLTEDAKRLRENLAASGVSPSNLAFVTSAELTPVKAPRSSRRYN